MERADEMNPMILSVGEGRYEITAVVTFCEQDLAVIMTGGKAHIGTAALAVPRPSLTGNPEISATASVLCVNGHREDGLARESSLYLAAKINASVLVAVGMHLDDAKAADIEQLVTNLMALR